MCIINFSYVNTVPVRQGSVSEGGQCPSDSRPQVSISVPTQNYWCPDFAVTNCSAPREGAAEDVRLDSWGLNCMPYELLTLPIAAVLQRFRITHHLNVQQPSSSSRPVLAVPSRAAHSQLREAAAKVGTDL